MTETNAATKTAEAARNEATMMPPVDVFEDAGGITLYADLPGVPREKLSLHVEAGTLTIEGELALALPEGMEASHAEVSLPRYRRMFTLSKELDTEKVAAEFTKQFPKLDLVTVDKDFNGWKEAQPKFFNDGGIFDQIYQAQ
jgi:HSP20 family molecular chaperone IbpA